MSFLLNPIIALLNQMRFRSKFLVMSLATLLPLLLLSGLNIHQNWLDWLQLKSEIQGVRAAESLLLILHDGHRLQADLRSGADVSGQVDTLAADLQNAALADKFSHTDYTELQQQWQKAALAAQRTIALQSVDQLLQRLDLAVLKIQENSGLILDADTTRFGLQKLVYTDLLTALHKQGDIQQLLLSSVGSTLIPQSMGQLVELQRALQAEQAVIRNLGEWVLHDSVEEHTVLKQRLDELNQVVNQVVQQNQLVIEGSLVTPEDLQNIRLAIETSVTVDNQIARYLSQSILQDEQNSKTKALFWAVLFVVIVILILLLQRAVQMSLEAFLQQSGKVLSGLAKGNLTQRLQWYSADEMQEITININTMAESFHGVVRRLADMSQRLASSAEELSQTSAQSSTGAADQATQAEQVIGAVSQMNESIANMAENAQVTSEETSRGKELTEQGTAHVQNTVSELQELSVDMQRTSEIFTQLRQNADAMSTILSVIRGVADQTNLLALNAAIEAARAGEMGRGFAVVADEVRTLAGRTQQSTQEIDQLIKRLQDQAGRAESAIEVSLRRSGQCVTGAQAADHSLQQVMQAMVRVVDKTIEVASVVEQQSRVASQIKNNITVIGDVTQKNSLVFRETASASAELSRLADNLSTLVESFQI